MIIRIVKMAFQEDKIEDFLEIFEFSKNKILAFDGCRYLQLMNDKSDPSVFFTYSIWESEEHLAGYRSSELFNTTWAKTRKLFAKPAEAWTLTRLFESTK